ncbi:MAG: DPP IV N-terminal domain-containing protein [Bacteroidaceae bacterium]|nr:DPP IV N-terminal domain-containing protein [Bacteroidaceae bacterium]
MKYIFHLVLFFVMATTVKAGTDLQLEDIVNGVYGTRGISGVTPLNDGETYAMIQDARRIVAYSFKTGKQTQVIFDVDQAKGKTRLGRIDGYIMSPDEKNILIRTETKPIYRRSRTAVYYIYNVRNKTLERLSDGGPQECPVFSPDGNMIAFVREGNIFLVKLLFNNAESQVTKDGEYNKVINGKPDWVYEEEFVTDCSLCFNADNTMLMWIRYDESEVPLYSFPLFKGSFPEMEEYADYPGAYTYKYPVAGAKNSKVSVHSYDIKSHVIRQIKLETGEEDYIPRIFATSDPTKLAIFTLNRHQDRMDVYMANPRSSEVKMVVRDEVSPYITEDMYNSIHFFEGGFVFCSERDGWNHIYQYDLNGMLKKQVTKGQFEVINFYGYDPLTGSFYYSSNEESPLREGIYKTDAKGKVTKLSQHTGINGAVFSKSFKYFVNTYTDINTPIVTQVCDQNGKTLRVLEDNRQVLERLQGKNLGKKEFFTFKTSEGVELNGIMIKPWNFDQSKKYPVIMFQYGGPGSQEVKDEWNIGNCGGAMLEQYLGEQGYISVIVDGRGTGGRGANFEKQTYLHLGVMEAKDQVETALYLGAQPYVDAQRIGIWGWSFGGFNTLMSMSEGRPVFRAGVAVAPPTSWKFYDTVYTERFMRTPKENKGYEESAISRAPQLSGELLICHGMADDNVHFRNTAEYVEALVQAEKINFKQLCFTNRNHSIYGGKTRLFLYKSLINWFKEKM